MRTRKTFYNWLTNRYQLVIRNEENFAQKSSTSFTYAKVILFSTLAFLILLALALFLAQGILASVFDPRYEQLQNQLELVKLNRSVDSLNVELDRKERFIQKFKAIVEGDDALLLEAEPGAEPMLSPDEQLRAANEEVDLNEYEQLDSAFRTRFELDDPLYQVSLNNINESDLGDMFFFSPLTGAVSSPFKPSTGHFGVDVVSRPSEPVKCVADGTVIFADMTQKDGYVLAVQHRQNIISVYKHNNELLKKVGNFVSAGDVISIVGNTGELSDGPHLHFELWYNGNPVDPEEFVTF